MSDITYEERLKVQLQNQRATIKKYRDEVDYLTDKLREYSEVANSYYSSIDKYDIEFHALEKEMEEYLKREW